MKRLMCACLVLISVVGCQQQNESMQNEAAANPPVSVQKVPDSTEQIQELTLQVVYENGEEVRVHYVQDEEEQWVYHNDLLPKEALSEEELAGKMNMLTVEKATFTEEVLQQMRYVFEFDGVYDVLDLEITFDDGTTRQYKQ